MSYDSEILALIPHRPPMLLINQLHEISGEHAQAIVNLQADSPFVNSRSRVPAWVGLEYMGQTAALIAGYQQREGLCEPHLGFLLGCRNYQADVSHFSTEDPLLVTAQQATVVGDSLATFNCTIAALESGRPLAQALLSVFRQPLQQTT